MCQHCDGYLPSCPICREEPKKEKCEYCNGTGEMYLDECGNEHKAIKDNYSCKSGCECNIVAFPCGYCDGNGYVNEE